jgi:hypothetical protein
MLRLNPTHIFRFDHDQAPFIDPYHEKKIVFVPERRAWRNSSQPSSVGQVEVKVGGTGDSRDGLEGVHMICHLPQLLTNS